jgi:cytochrome o ubiquinol oxidase subunit II
MPKIYKALLLLALASSVVFLIIFFLFPHNAAILSPGGVVAGKERSLIILSTILMMVVVVPVYIMTFLIAWRYRASNLKALYAPNWDRDKLLEITWWVVPGIIVCVLGVIAWQGSRDLDPFKPLDSEARPLVVQVVALQWKWLFIYPEQSIATVNFLEFPSNRPINFEITSDAPMNSFWIPRLGGQIYAMPGMSTQLHLMANKDGSYVGSSANISGRGFASMKFVAKSSSEKDFRAWVNGIHRSKNPLLLSDYNKLSSPGENDTVVYYSYVSPGLYANTIMKYTMPMRMDPNLDSLPASSLLNPNNL